MSNRPLRVLLAEDDNAHATLVQRSLEEHGFDVELIHVRDGEEALRYLHLECPEPENCPLPDLVLLDLRMPKTDGLEVLRQIKSDGKLHRLPVVVLTTSAAESDVDKAYELKANSYLVKPADFEKFSRLMRDLGLYWSRWNTAPRMCNLPRGAGEEGCGHPGRNPA